MAQDITQIISLLDDIQKSNTANADNFDRLLTSISSKLDMSVKNSASDIIRSYVNELSKLVDDRFDMTADKFENIEKALKAIYDSQDNSVKGADLKELFDVLSKNVNNFYTEARQQKAIISGIEAKISDILNNKTDKEDILRTISLLRNDFGNINASYKTSFDDINTTLKSVISTLRSVDPLKTGEAVITQIDIMFKSIHEIATNLNDINEKESEIEKILSNVVTNEDLKVTQGIINSIIEKTEKIEDKLNSGVQREDLSELKKAIDSLYDGQVSKHEVINIKEQTENILNQAEEIKLSLSKVAQHIDNISDSSELSEGLIKLHEQISVLSESISTSDTEDNVIAITEGIKGLREEFDTIRNIITDLNEIISDKISQIADSSRLTDSEFKEAIAKLSERTLQADDIAQIIQNNRAIIEINDKTGYISKQLDILPAIKENVEEIVNKLPSIDIKDEISTIYNKTNAIENWLKETNSKDTVSDTKNSDETYAFEKIHKRLDNLQDDVEEIKDYNERILRNNNDIENNIVSVSEFVKNNSPTDDEYIKKELNSIKALIEANAQDIDNLDAENPDIKCVKNYLSEIKELINLNTNAKLYEKLLSIEDTIVNNHTFNESALSQMIDKIGNIQYGENSDTNNQIAQAINEISVLQSQINDLQKQFSDLNNDNIDNPEELYVSRIEEFISAKLTEVSGNLAKITGQSEDKFEQGFAYQTELLEQKTAKLQELVEQLNVNKNAINPELEKKLNEASEILGDFRQELQFVSTDITEGISKNTSQILNEITPIVDTLNKINDNLSSKSLKADVEDLNNELVNAPELSEVRQDIEDLYGRLTEKFIENENNLKDFILTDTDSIIIKLDNLKDYVEESMNSFVPPDTTNMKELNSFIKNINEFKEDQAQLLSLSIEEVKHEIAQQSEEIKSMISVVNNHDEIISAIEELKNIFNNAQTKHNKEDISTLEKEQNTSMVSFDSDMFLELKENFEKYSKKIEKLSDENSQITQVLNDINERLNNINSVSQDKVDVSVGREITDEDFEISDDDIFGGDKFDFVQAFDILQHDISSLKDAVQEAKKDSEDKDSLKIPSINNSGMLMNVNSKLDEVLKSLNKNWLEDINNYIQTSNIAVESKLDSIESKLDIFVTDTTNTDLLNEVSDTLNEITDSVSEIVPRLEEIAPVIEERLTESDKKLSTMLEELNQKIGLIGSDDNSIEELNNIKSLIGEQKNYIEKLEPSDKLEAFKKCLDEISFEVNALATDSNADNEKLDKTIKDMKESLMSAVITIFDQVSFVEESEDIKDFVEERTDEINQNIALITQQLKQITSSGETQDYTYSMQDIETDLAKLRLALKELQENKKDTNAVDFSEISEKLHSINSSVDLLTQDEIKDLKSEITVLKEQTQFLIATSDKSYDAINSGIEGFGEKFNENLTDKVEKLTKMLENSAESDRVIRQALIYMGEWIDSASKSINKISANSEEITNINNVIEGITELRNTISINTSELFEQKFNNWNKQINELEQKISAIENLETRFDEQQKRIDRLEINIDKLLNIVENLDNPGISRKIDKIEKQISKLGTNIEKLASYVD